MAGAAVALHDPGAVRGLSFGLSFGAVAGILSIGLPLQRRLSPRLPRPLRWPLELCAISLGATAGALPLTAWTFQELALTAAVANLPAGALLAWWVLPAGALALWCPPLAGVALPAAEAGLAALEGWLALTRGPLLHPSVGPLGAAALGLAVLCARWPGRALGLAALALSLRSLPPGGELRVTFLAVGQGDAALIEDRGRRVLVDGGPGAWDVARYLRRRGLDRLDAVVLSHPHPDHMAGLPAVLEVADVGALWLPRPPRPGEDAFQALCDRARRLGVPLRYPGDEGLEVLHPSPDFLAATDDVNEGSLVFRVSLGRTRALFTGDIEALGEAALLAALSEDGPIEGPISWLKVPHHGSRTSSSAALVARLAPRVAVLSAAPDSRFGHPHPEVLRRYAGALALRTDRLGTVQLRSDGERESWRAWTPGRGWGGWREVPAGRAAPPEDAAPMAGWWPPSAPAPEGLHAVAYRGDPEQLAALLDAGADPRAPDPWGDTPIYLAIEGGNLDAARLLRWRGASLDVGRPPVCAAARFSRLEALEWLIGAGAPLAVSCYSGGPLHLAVAAGGDDPAVVEALLRAGADPRGRDERGRSESPGARRRFASRARDVPAGDRGGEAVGGPMSSPRVQSGMMKLRVFLVHLGALGVLFVPFRWSLVLLYLATVLAMQFGFEGICHLCWRRGGSAALDQPQPGAHAGVIHQPQLPLLHQRVQPRLPPTDREALVRRAPVRGVEAAPGHPADPPDADVRAGAAAQLQRQARPRRGGQRGAVRVQPTRRELPFYNGQRGLQALAP
jgi:beta-lactamase superfamily II metal-dependent hydrolase